MNWGVIMEENQILKEVINYRNLMGCFCKKLTGSATCQAIRKHLRNKAFNISQRDVYIKGIPNEIDLLLLKDYVNEKMLVYDPKDVLAVFEIKFSGSYGEDSIENTKKLGEKIKGLNKNIRCLYVTLLETKTYKYRITKENTGFNIFEIFYKKGNLGSKNFKTFNTGDWDRLLNYLKKIGK